MKYRIKYTSSYNKRAKKFLDKHPEVSSQYEKVLKILELNPFHKALRLHKIDGKYRDLHSVSINMSVRLTIEFLIKDKEIIPINIGDHDQVY